MGESDSPEMKAMQLNIDIMQAYFAWFAEQGMAKPDLADESWRTYRRDEWLPVIRAAVLRASIADIDAAIETYSEARQMEDFEEAMVATGRLPDETKTH